MSSDGNQTTLVRVALISGLIGMFLFILTPFMPVNQVQSSLSWPQNGSLQSVNAPLESYTPVSMDVAIPLAALSDLRTDQQLVFGTLPQDSEKATSRGMFVRSSDGGLEVIVRDNVLFELTKDEVSALPEGSVLDISSTEQSTSVIIPGAKDSSGDEYKAEIDQDKRPQITGVYTELNDTADAAKSLTDAGLNVNVEINSRYTSSPSVWKYLSMWGGGLFTLISLFCLFKIDRLDGRGRIHSLSPKAWVPTLLDAVVGGILIFWYIFGANTSDDGFILTMARASEHSGYMANYYRWFGVPESPFGAPYYDLLAQFAKVSTASTWMRLPSLICALGIWFLLSRMVMPILGEKIAGRRVAQWTAAFLFLAFWLAYDNGLRPEPPIALGALATWVLFERAIATKRLFPAALGTIVAAFSLACGPTGLMAVAALLAGLSGVLRIMFDRVPLLSNGTSRKAHSVAWLGLLAPFFAGGFSVLVAVFGDQTLMSVLESIQVRSAKGPSLAWYQEFARYQVLMQQTVDGSFARRFAFFFLVVSFVLVVASTLRNGKVPGSRRGPSQRLVLVILGTFFFLMFTPTKWTHHFGIFAGIGAAIGGLAAVALSQFALRSKRNRTLLIGLILFVFAFTLAGTNGWWYTSSYAIPWFDKSIQFKGIEASTVMLFISLLVLFIGVLQSFTRDLRGFQAEAEGKDAQAEEAKLQRGRKDRFAGLAAAPIAVVCAIAVFFSVASFAKGFISQYPAYSVGLGNLRSLAGNKCGLANDVLVETNSNDSFLTPVSGSLGDSLSTGEERGFNANGIPPEVNSEIPQGDASAATANSVGDTEASTTQDSSTSGGVRQEGGVNGSNARLPFGLDYAKIPVLGSYANGEQFYAEDTTQWYELPQATDATPLIVVSAAGRIEHVDINGIKQDGQSLMLQYGRREADGSVTELGEKMMLDIGPSPSWRNLRLPLNELPSDANVVRIHAVDSSLDQKQWLAFTPPRVPTLDTLNNVVGSQVPVLLDWSVPLQFPCQRPFDHYAGVAEIPEYRISPDAGGKTTGTPFQDFAGGGVMGTADAVNYSYQLPSYSKSDWLRDWGSIEVLHPRPNSEGQIPQVATIDTEVVTRSGLWYPGKMNIDTE
ncbi:arabinosyltransferase [Corynebacterium vitaeruminis DSM 20294]|uniref:Arabinosyltransferase n=2 Tax=Corynebacterium vitaeruminis TaxID=38305 RepID=W5XXY2_9CORY|nr:arabinosyltransferase [Corynebacterium vitaeruminis DSM 20294]